MNHPQPIDRFVDHLNALSLHRLAWLERVGPIAKQMNLESLKDHSLKRELDK